MPKQYHLRFDIPDQKPYDRFDWYLQAYGNLLLPFLANHSPQRFWFSRYQEPNMPKHLLVRYESETMFDPSSLDIQPSEHTEFDIHADLSGTRFLGTNQRGHNAPDRGSKIFDFLHAAALLTLDQISHQDQDGYWAWEENPDSGNNHFGRTLESVHHLFCNLSAIPTAVVIVDPVEANQKQISQIQSPLYAKCFGVLTPNSPVIPVQY